jgi:hypothetical protein
MVPHSENKDANKLSALIFYVLSDFSLFPKQRHNPKFRQPLVAGGLYKK